MKSESGFSLAMASQPFEFVLLQVASRGLQLGFQHKEEQGQSTILLPRSLQNLMTCWHHVS